MGRAAPSPPATGARATRPARRHRRRRPTKRAVKPARRRGRSTPSPLLGVAPVTHRLRGTVVGSSRGRGTDLAQRGGPDLRRLAVDAEALGGGEGDPGPARALDRGRRGPGPGGRADARARPLARGAAARGPRRPARLRLRRGPAPGHRERAVTRAEAAERDRARGGADRARDAPARHADGARGDARPSRTSRRSSTWREVLGAGFPLVALLQLVRVYAQSIRKIAEAEVRLFHLYVHEPLIRQGVDALEMAEEMEGLAARPAAADLAADGVHPPALPALLHRAGRRRPHGGRLRRRCGRWAGCTMAFCFVDLTGFTRYTEEEGDEEALDLVERFVETVEATLPAEALIVKTIGDEVMIVSPDPVTLTEWAVGFLDPVPGAPAAAGRDPLRARRLPRRRLLRHRRQPHPPGRRPGARRRGDGDDARSSTRSATRPTSSSSRSAGSSSRASRSRSSCSSSAPASRTSSEPSSTGEAGIRLRAAYDRDA